MVRNRITGRLVRRSHKALVTLLPLVLITGLAIAAPSQAATTPPPTVTATQARLLASQVNAAIANTPSVATVSPPAQQVTVNISSGVPLDPAKVRPVVNQVNSENGHLSATVERILAQNEQTVPGLLTQQNLNSSQGLDYTGSVASSADGTGFSITRTNAEVETSQAAWQTVIAGLIGMGSGLAVRLACDAGLTAAFLSFLAPGAVLGFVVLRVIATICATLSTFVGAAMNGLITQAFAGTLGDPAALTRTMITAAIFAGGAVAYETGLALWLAKKLPAIVSAIGTSIGYVGTALGWLGSGFAAAIKRVRDFVTGASGRISQDVEMTQVPASPSSDRSCDVYDFNGTPCGAAHSTVRALYATYAGPLYQVRRGTSLQNYVYTDIHPVAPGGVANAPAQDAFCGSAPCVISKIYDQTFNWNDLSIEGVGGASGGLPDHGADAKALPVTVNGQKAYGVSFTGQVGYRNDQTMGIATGSEPEGMYMVTSGTHVNQDCCFDYGNVETDNNDDFAGTMDAVNFGTKCYFQPCTGVGPWVQADLENGLFAGDNGVNLANKGNASNFVTALLKNDGVSTYALKGGNSQVGPLSTWWDGGLPTRRDFSGNGYRPMRKQGAIVLGTGGDNSNGSVGSFFEGVMTEGYPSDQADNEAAAGVVAAKYGGSSGPTTGGSAGGGPVITAEASSQADAAVIHDGYSSVFTANSADSHLTETYLSKIGARWVHQDMSALYHSPSVAPGTTPVALKHDVNTSVFTIDKLTGDLWETFLHGPVAGQGWSSQDLSANYRTPPSRVTPTVVLHNGYTSVYTVDRSNGHLDETFLTGLGAGWQWQDLTDKYGTPAVQAGTSPVAIFHTGYTSVYTVDASNHDLDETFLDGPPDGRGWKHQDLTQNYGTPATYTTPTAVAHNGFTSVYTVDQVNNDLEETFLNGPPDGRGWRWQNLTDAYHTPPVAPGTVPAALFHNGYTSVYTVDQGTNHLEETYLNGPPDGPGWTAQDLSNNYGPPPTTGPRCRCCTIARPAR